MDLVERLVRKAAGLEQSLFALCPARCANGEAIVTDGYSVDGCGESLLKCLDN